MTALMSREGARIVLLALAASGAAQLGLPASARAQQADWSKTPRMQLERQFAGPLRDTIIQRWRDPEDGTVCMIYLPINAPHSPQQQSGYVQYGAANIGSISCFAGAAPAPAAARAAAAPPTAAVVPAVPPARNAAPAPRPSTAPPAAAAPASLDQRFAPVLQWAPAEPSR
jgi:hypothetical protein